MPLVHGICEVMALCLLSLQAGELQQGGWSALFKGRYRRIMILASALPILQQLSGINTVVFYSSDVSSQVWSLRSCRRPLHCPIDNDTPHALLIILRWLSR